MNLCQIYGKAVRRLKKEMKTATGRYLPRVECHITDHCNLNCCGCSHFSNIAPETYKDIEEFEKELKCLSGKLIIDELKLLGGEPLLHPDLPEFFVIARRCLPKAEITLCTNCLLLDKMSDGFWESMKDNKIKFVLSIYPPLRDKTEHYRTLIAEKGIEIAYTHLADEFWAMRNRKGDSDPQQAYRQCTDSYCRNLRKGRLYICPDACYMDYYNAYFEQSIPRDEGIDIYQNSGRKIVKYLSEYKETCKYCTKYSIHPWRQTEKKIGEWDAVED